MAENSLFAVLLRSRWWISFAICAAVVLVSLAVFPKDISPFAALGAFPFFIVGCMAFYKQMNGPSPARLLALQELAAQQSWADFSAQLQAAWQAEGYAVERLNLPGADMTLVRNGQSCVVGARRWKAAAHGQEPLRELLGARAKLQADQAIYVALQPLSESSAAWARQNEIIVLDAKGVALLLSKAPR
ncbi:restriction endonuclease [Comamonas resistens]|uniref:restriction endonuclease n=1 Tax=Comamonas resistens TaxID=3046670 RepID=UPI0039BCFC56